MSVFLFLANCDSTASCVLSARLCPGRAARVRSESSWTRLPAPLDLTQPFVLPVLEVVPSFPASAALLGLACRAFQQRPGSPFGVFLFQVSLPVASHCFPCMDASYSGLTALGGMFLHACILVLMGVLCHLVVLLVLRSYGNWEDAQTTLPQLPLSSQDSPY